MGAGQVEIECYKRSKEHSNFVLLAIDTDRQSDIAQGLGAPYNPTMLFVDKEGSEVKKIVGYVQTAVFLEGIKEVFNHGHQH